MTFFITHSGRNIEIDKLTEDDICLDDIAHHLSKICRYGGAMDFDLHYSVANHCIALCQYAIDTNESEDLQRALLMHDASEYLLGDMVTAVKEQLPDYRGLEKKVEQLIISKYSLPPINSEVWDFVKYYDTRILLDEARQFLPDHVQVFQNQLYGVKPLDIDLRSELNYIYGTNSYAFNLFYTKNRFLYYCNILGITD